VSVDLFLGACAALTADHYEETPPPADLRGLVACRWVRLVRKAGGPSRSPILPDGCADVLVYDDAPPFAVGPDATTRWTTLRAGTVITGLRLRPGAVRAVLGCPATEIVDGGARLADLAPGARALHERLLLSGNLRGRQELLEDWVRAAAARSAADDRAVVAACGLLAADPRLALDGVARRFGWHARAMHRRFREACGYGPKHLQRIMRLQRALRLTHEGAAGLAAVALDAGYADQAHMSRDFRALTGFTPRASFATSPAETERGAAYEFVLNHVVDVDSPTSLFRINVPEGTDG